MLTPNRRRKAVERLQDVFGVSQRRASAVVGQPRSTQRLARPVPLRPKPTFVGYAASLSEGRGGDGEVSENVVTGNASTSAISASFAPTDRSSRLRARAPISYGGLRMSKRRVMTQWGREVRPFGAYSEAEIDEILSFCSGICSLAESFLGVKSYLAYGALLGLVREGGLIDHDFDIDVALHFGKSNVDEVAAAMRDLQEWFLGQGYGVKAKSFGQYKVVERAESGSRAQVEIFASWEQDDKLFLYFTASGADLVETILPIGEVDLCGSPFGKPNDPEALLASTYGPDWRTPDPEFKYEMKKVQWGPFANLFFSRGRGPWDRFYARAVENEKLPQHPSELGVLANSDLKADSRIVEFGSGNGHDSALFAAHGHTVLATDYSAEAVNLIQELAATENLPMQVSELNLYDVPDCVEFSNAHAASFDVAYGRFILNSISEVGEANFLRVVARVLLPQGRLFVEFRTSSPEDQAGSELKTADGRYERLVDRQRFEASAAEQGLILEEQHAGTLMAEADAADSKTCRLTLRSSE